MTAAPIHLAGERLMLDPAGALFWPAHALLVVSDLHLEKGSSFAARGALLPPWDTRTTLDRLALLLRRWRPRTIVALGDSFHDRAAASRLAAADRARLLAMTQSAKFVWVSGNHDPDPPDGFPGVVTNVFSAGKLLFRHEAASPPDAEISGHFHPKAAIPTRAGAVSRPCFVADAHRILLPAFGAYTGGLDVQSPAIAQLFPRGGRVFLLGRDRLFSFALGAPPRTPASNRRASP
jgi:DNA ligase-associated metallophosphoesterase